MASSAYKAKAEALLAKDREANPIRYYRPRSGPMLFHMAKRADTGEWLRTRFAGGPNRASKTYASCAEGTVALTGIEPMACPGMGSKFHQPPVHGRHWGNKQQHLVDVVLPIYLKLIPRRMLDENHGENGFNKSEAKLYLTNGSTLTFATYQQMKQESESRSSEFEALDEPPPEALYEALYARVADQGGYIWGAMTLHEERSEWPVKWVERRIMHGGDGPMVGWFQYDVVENFQERVKENGGWARGDKGKAVPATDEGRRIWSGFMDWCGAMSAEEYDIRILGKCSWAAGTVFKRFDKKLHAGYTKLQPQHFQSLVAKGYGDVFCGLDHGLDHPTACVWVFVARRDVPPACGLDIAAGDYLQFWEYRVAHASSIYVHIAAIQNVNKMLGVRPVHVFGSWDLANEDDKGRATNAAEYRKAGIPLVVCGKCEIDLGITAIDRLLIPRDFPTWAPWPRLRILPKCQMTVDELEGWCFNPKWGVGQDRDKYVKVGEDIVACWRHLALRNPGKPMPQAGQSVRDEPLEEVTGVPLSLLRHQGLAALVGAA